MADGDFLPFGSRGLHARSHATILPTVEKTCRSQIQAVIHTNLSLCAIFAGYPLIAPILDAATISRPLSGIRAFRTDENILTMKFSSFCHGACSLRQACKADDSWRLSGWVPKRHECPSWLRGRVLAQKEIPGRSGGYISGDDCQRSLQVYGDKEHRALPRTVIIRGAINRTPCWSVR